MKDYSQGGEQAAILKGLGWDTDVPFRPGRFLDIGAWHPTIFSNTRALIELGWAGILVEPSPLPAAGLLKEYGESESVAIVHAAVTPGPADTLIDMHISDDGVSTSSAGVYATWKEHATYHGILVVPAITLERIAVRFGTFDFWSIDAEGQSADIFLRMLELEYRPRCVCVEHDGRGIELIMKATDAGYKCTMATAENLVFAR